MGSYRISQLAERTGVPASTLRFYESAGLLPAERTASGYRVYGPEAVERLAFISSAKALGLPLEEIRALVTAREQGECGPVREQMRTLVAHRITDAERRQAQLAAFSTQLGNTHQQLSGPAPEGPCGRDCGCTASSSTGAMPSPPRPEPPMGDDAWRHTPVACTLGPEHLAGRTGQWRTVVSEAVGQEEIPDGLRLTFPAGAERAGRIAALAAAEQECCSFFTFTLQLAPAVLILTVRAPAEAAVFLTDLFGIPVRTDEGPRSGATGPVGR